MKHVRIGLVLGSSLVLACASSGRNSDTPPEDILRQPEHARWSERAPDLYRAAFETSRGRFVIEVHRDWAPIGADHFYNLVRMGYYDDTRFHRVLPNYIVQWGLHGDPAINRIWSARKIEDDPWEQKQSNTRATIGYAMTGPNDRATQVYINLRDNSRNDGQGLVPFGAIVEGMEVVDSLYNGYGANSGDGVRQGKQGPIVEGGNAYLQKEFPKLDYIRRARIIVLFQPNN
jgi:cyclophilin family peptidyl-prolyl cis-trans isomerase